MYVKNKVEEKEFGLMFELKKCAVLELESGSVDEIFGLFDIMEKILCVW